MRAGRHSGQPSRAPGEIYRKRLEERRDELESSLAAHGRLGLLRLAALAAGVAVGWAVWSQQTLSAWWLTLPLLLFLALGQRMQRMEKRHARLERTVTLYEEGLERLAGRWPGSGPRGERHLRDEHPYARDLDLFGHGSLFQLLCAARTSLGQSTLARWLLHAAAPEEIRHRNAAVEELAEELDLRERIAVLGDDVGDEIDPGALHRWVREPALGFSRAAVLAVRTGAALGLVAFFALFAWLAAVAGLVELPGAAQPAIRIYLSAAVLVLGLVTWRTRGAAGDIVAGIEEPGREIDLMAELLHCLQEARFQAPLLVRLVDDLDSGESPPSARIRALGRLVQLENSRDNFMVRLFGFLVLWDLQLAIAIDRWRTGTGAALERWLEVIGTMEALASLARYRYERPATVFPELIDGGGRFEAERLAHPLLPDEGLVRNDVALGVPHRVLVVSGSNMSGKSTLLRTVGVAAVMAQAGGSVRAASLRLSPLNIGASIRIQDSLREGTSRFYAEILRLRTLVELAGGDPPALFLIDEFLHGTNSHDRRAGAAAIISGLVERGAIGLVTTHDLALTDIVGALGEAAANVHFADDLRDGRMSFDYRLREGVVQKSNAIELMRSVGLEV